MQWWVETRVEVSVKGGDLRILSCNSRYIDLRTFGGMGTGRRPPSNSRRRALVCSRLAREYDSRKYNV